MNRGIYLLMLFLLLSIRGWSNDYRFRYLNTSQGLSHSSIISIVEDEDGLVWLGSRFGLNSFNGFSVKNYFHDPYDSTSLSDDFIQSMYADGSKIWIGTANGLSCYDKTFQHFKRYEIAVDQVGLLLVYDIEKDTYGNLILATNRGAFILFEGATVAQPIPNAQNEKNISFFDIALTDNKVWFLSEKGLFAYHISPDDFDLPVLSKVTIANDKLELSEPSKLLGLDGFRLLESFAKLIKLDELI